MQLVKSYFFQIEGSKGENSQTTASDLDVNTNVLFLTQLNRDGVACWNTKKPLQPESLALFAHDAEALVFTNDIKVRGNFIMVIVFFLQINCNYRLMLNAICGYSPTRCRCLYINHSTLNSTITGYLEWRWTMPLKIHHALIRNSECSFC